MKQFISLAIGTSALVLASSLSFGAQSGASEAESTTFKNTSSEKATLMKGGMQHIDIDAGAEKTVGFSSGVTIKILDHVCLFPKLDQAGTGRTCFIGDHGEPHIKLTETSQNTYEISYIAE